MTLTCWHAGDSAYPKFNFDIFHRVGIKNQAADLLSRPETRDRENTDINDDIRATISDLDKHRRQRN